MHKLEWLVNNLCEYHLLTRSPLPRRGVSIWMRNLATCATILNILIVHSTNQHSSKTNSLKNNRSQSTFHIPIHSAHRVYRWTFIEHLTEKDFNVHYKWNIILYVLWKLNCILIYYIFVGYERYVHLNSGKSRKNV